MNIPYLKTNQYSENVNIDKATKILLIAYGKGKGKDVEIYSDLVICIYTSTHILSIRNFDNCLNDKMSYIIPITINSVEHIQLSVMKDIPQNLYFQNVAKVTILLRKFAGVLPSNQFFSNESPHLVYNWIQGNYKDKWMLPRISDLRELAITLSHKDNRLISDAQLNHLIELEEKICQHDNYLFDGLYQEIQEIPSVVTKSESFDSSDKRILENLSTQFEISQLQTNICDSVVNNQLNYLTLNPETIQKPYLDNIEVSNDIKTEWENLYMEINELKSNLSKTQTLLKNTESELSDFKIATDRLQKRYEEIQEQYRNLNIEFGNTVNIKDTLQKRLNDLQEDYVRLQKSKNMSLEIEKFENVFSNSEKQKKTSTDASLDPEKVYLLEENSRLKKIIENKTSDFEFLRSQYQEVSSSASNLSNEVKQLEVENFRLKNKAEGEAIRLKEIMIQLLEKKMNERIEELEFQNSLYLKQLKQKINHESTKQMCFNERFRATSISQDNKVVSRENMVKNTDLQNLEDSNNHLVPETIENINEF